VKNIIDPNAEKAIVQKHSTNIIGGKLDYDHYYHDCYHEEQLIYQHLLHLVKKESADQMLNRFHCLFIERANYPEPEILPLLDKITASKTAPEEFKFFLNRCCHILINYWHMNSLLHGAITDLINLFSIIPTTYKVNNLCSREINRLRDLVKLFVDSEQYLILLRFTQVVNENQPVAKRQDNKPLMTLIRRYPYLYEHCLMSDDSTFEQKETVRHFQSQVQKKFEIDLSQYVTYKMRRIQMLKNTSIAEANRILRPVNNPTLLTDGELYTTLKHFVGKVEHGNTYHESAQQFIKYGGQAANFRNFKDDLYEYLISSVDGQYGKKQFNQKLYKYLQNTLPQADEQKVNDLLLVRTCSNLLNFLVVNNQSSPQHFVFLDLISNQGTVPTMGLLLKIVLICGKVKPYLERKFAILFNHYEASNTNSVGWLVGTLEQLNIAFSINFGGIDLSFFKRFC
jgi:nucleoside diphosphate kinase